MYPGGPRAGVERALVADVKVAAAPASTYRVQFGPHFRFADGERIVPYLDALGIGYLYASPYFRARPGSEHGYDVVDHNSAQPRDRRRGRATRDDRRVAQRRGIGHLVDFVPNHMGIGADNPWWNDVLALGRRSAYAHFFDIDWRARIDRAAARSCCRFWATTTAASSSAASWRVTFDPATGTFALRYFEHAFPLAPHTYAVVLAVAARARRRNEPRELRELADVVRRAARPVARRGRAGRAARPCRRLLGGPRAAVAPPIRG